MELLLHFAKILAVAVLFAGTLGAFVARDLRDRRRLFAYALAGPGFGASAGLRPSASPRPWRSRSCRRGSWGVWCCPSSPSRSSSSPSERKGGVSALVATLAIAPLVSTIALAGLEAMSSPGQWPALAALRHRDFRLLWLSLLGVSPWAPGCRSSPSPCSCWTSATDRSFALGTVSLAQSVAFLAFALFGGAVADRVDRRRLTPGHTVALHALCGRARCAHGAAPGGRVDGRGPGLSSGGGAELRPAEPSGARRRSRAEGRAPERLLSPVDRVHQESVDAGPRARRGAPRLERLRGELLRERRELPGSPRGAPGDQGSPGGRADPNAHAARHRRSDRRRSCRCRATASAGALRSVALLRSLVAVDPPGDEPDGAASGPATARAPLRGHGGGHRRRAALRPQRRRGTSVTRDASSWSRPWPGPWPSPASLSAVRSPRHSPAWRWWASFRSASARPRSPSSKPACHAR